MRAPHRLQAMSVPAFLPRPQLQRLFEALTGLGYRIVGPSVRDGALIYEEITSASELPWGVVARRDAGSFRLEAGAGERCFAWANGPQALDPLVFAPVEPLWRMERRGAGLRRSLTRAGLDRPQAELRQRAETVSAITSPASPAPPIFLDLRIHCP